VEILTAQMESMREQLAVGGQTQSRMFANEPKTTTISIRREKRGDGQPDRLMYIPDRKDPDNIHHDVPGDRVVGRFMKIEIEDTEYEGEPVRNAILHIKQGDDFARIRMNANLKPKSSVALKSFLSNLENVPDDALVRELAFKPYPGNNPQAVMVSIVDPTSGNTFKSEGNVDPEDLKSQWRDSSHWVKVLEKTIARLERLNTQPIQNATLKSTVSNDPKSTNTTKPAAKDRTGEPISFIGSITLLVPEQLKRWSDEEDDRITRASLRVTVRRESDHRDIPCMLKDSLAVKVATLYHPTQRVSCSGVRAKDEKGKPIVLLDVLEAAVTAD